MNAEHHPLPECLSDKQLPSRGNQLRQRWLGQPGSRNFNIKNHAIACVGEFVGTMLFLVFALGGADVGSRAAVTVSGGSDRTEGEDAVVALVNTSNLLYASLSFGISLAVNVWIFARVSGGILNPAVTLALWIVGALESVRAALLVVAQFAGGIAGAAIVQALLPGVFGVLTTLSTGVSVTRGLFIEMFLTLILTLSILMLAVEKSPLSVVAPFGIGLALFIAEMTGIAFTGGSVNPARTLGPAVVAGSFVSYEWIYFLGPCLGAAVAAFFYRFLKFIEFETCVVIDVDVEKVQLIDPEARRDSDRTEVGTHLKNVDSKIV